jgi:hypothetical protein
MSQAIGSDYDKGFVTADDTYYSCIAAGYAKLLLGTNIDTSIVVN